ncbi:MAG: PEP-utilizing enzyme [Thaumarchaeota archaeon]|nr:PEP-utilizing enzyme [Nitrososphaerota archaeon]
MRSSAVQEDLPGASFAGQYETILGVSGLEETIKAAIQCWSSAFSPRVREYLSSNGLTNVPKMGVLIQQLVRADSAGVVFTSNPITGDHEEIVVNAVRGLGERLVSGQSSADEWIIKGSEPECLRNSESALNNESVMQIGNIARRIEEVFGLPQDIEWAFSRGRLFILQARPITALPERVEWKPPLPGTWLRNFRLGEWLGDPVTPLFESWLLERLEERMYEHFEKVLPMPTPRPYHVLVNSWYFTTANFLPSSRPKAVWLLIRYMLPAFVLHPRRFSTLIPSLSHWGMKIYEKEWRETIGPKYAEVVASGWKGVENADPKELVSLIDTAADAAGDFLYSLFAIAGSAWKPEYVFASFYQKHLSRQIGGSHQRLLQALGLTTPKSAEAHAVLSLDWYQPTLGELNLPLERDKDDDDGSRRIRAVEDRLRAESDCRKAIQNEPRLLKKFERLLFNAQQAARLREEQAPQLTQGWPLLRRAVQRLGEKLVSVHLLERMDDVFFLTREEVISGLRDPTMSVMKFSALVKVRRATWEKRRRLAPPLILGEMSWGAKNMLSRYEATLGGSRTVRNSEDGILSGLPASPGRFTGTVRIIKTAEEFVRLRSGEILVAPATTPAWTPLFRLAAAVVTDTGSLMAHASLVAREYGIPAVVGTGNATLMLKDGQVVTVDGSSGIIQFAVIHKHHV